MYRILMRQGWDGSEQVIHSEVGDGPRLMAATLGKAVDTYDTLTVSADPTNPLYGTVQPLQTFLRVVRPDKHRQLFEGRVWTYQPGDMATDGTLTNVVVAMGLEDVLHDSIQPFAEYHDISPRDFLAALISAHNAQVESWKQVQLGVVNVTNTTDNVYRYTDDGTDTYDTIQDKLVSRLGGEIRIRHEEDGLYLDYMTEIAEQSNQVIRLASNMLSLTQKLDPTAIFTVLKPLGKAADRTTTDDDGNSSTETSTPRLTIESVNSGSPFLRDEALIAEFGIITVAQQWDDVTDATNLLSKGKAMLAMQKPVKDQVQITAADLSMVNGAVDDFVCGNYNRIVNPLVSYDANRRIVTQDLDLCDPSQSTMAAGDVMLTHEQYTRQITLAAKTAEARLASTASQISSLNNKVTDLTGQAGTLAESEKALKALRAQPTVVLSAEAGVLQIEYTIVAGAVPADTYTPEISMDQNDWTPGDTISGKTGKFYPSMAGTYYVRVKATLDGYDSPYSPAARVVVTE
ncbi:phage tail spike protein [Lacticaseibacillus daqingensis]|uniref:phage tail spike protein n=1 Tax=Lacticaseibacillus daqingensis TaxID=2486014 RepID=UPI000F7B5B88|nr:phage tail spike protein [Lacticaseibacillus daqingensis]